MKLIDEIRKAEADGILASESCPEQHYWHWIVRKPELLSDRLREIYDQYEEIRWYGGQDERGEW